MLAANRIGKSEGVGAYETTLHLTGRYPAWWPGRRFDRPIRAWVASETHLKCRDVPQTILFGPLARIGTGMIPGECIGRRVMRAGVPDAIDTAWIRHEAGGDSVLKFKAYQQGPESFTGEHIDWLWADEEPPLAVYVEGLMRTLATVPGEANGSVLVTFTPLEGMSATVMEFLTHAVNRQPDWPTAVPGQ